MSSGDFDVHRDAAAAAARKMSPAEGASARSEARGAGFSQAQDGSTSSAPNLVITGFMGTGKTRVGREVARRLGRPFVDMDAEIEARAGKSIAGLFAEEGETAFRCLESALCRELAECQGLVIATGGGTLVDPDNRAAMIASGTTVCLTAPLEEVLQRLGSAELAERPLLDGADSGDAARRLLTTRHAAYAAIPWQVDTTGRPVEQVAAEVASLASVWTRIVRHPGGTYPLHLGTGLLAHLGGALRAVVGESAGASRVAVVSNPVVESLYGQPVRVALARAGFHPVACSMPDGERHKTLATVASLYEQFLAGGLDRGDSVLSLGGGVTGDVAGFTAATFMRGVRWVQVPTTLLAMVDASVGGKTGVDLAQGKNLVGAFKQPAMVLADPAVLATLPREEMRSGMAEALKHGILAGTALFTALERPPTTGPSIVSEAQLARVIQVKIDIVEQDPNETGQRAVLNLGHTVGHALERLSGYDQHHGEAVAIGLVAAARLAVALGRAETSLAERIASALEAWELPIHCPPFPAEAIWAAMTTDKKRRAGTTRWALPHAIGQVEIVEGIDQEVVLRVLRCMGAG
jgi:shikimate kinase/3-dehydroquinate synthase